MKHSLHHRIKRALRHARSSAGHARRAFPPDDLKAFAEAITAGEQTHRGEVRLIVEKALPLDAAWGCMSSRQRALALFADHGVWDTEENCGVLIYVNLAEHQVEIVADRGIDRKIGQATWQNVCRTLTEGYARGEFRSSTLDAIGQVNQLLRQHFPSDGPRPNELPDHPVML
ncbi:TPM domain-containing protein [Massilia solisilvae]|uniref:TPM domain-containing protein n=1 Tax=Massilia solisilvae TaxID=1811225 RepID=A0ABT2BIT3_9BURK|nr:TPM domain-containing protein [Massilia solisilvae]MCS0608428.1 TPM domain-containing protein [Massilia solisilvae]